LPISWHVGLTTLQAVERLALRWCIHMKRRHRCGGTRGEGVQERLMVLFQFDRGGGGNAGLSVPGIAAL
jgi:hypothetical protein